MQEGRIDAYVGPNCVPISIVRQIVQWRWQFKHAVASGNVRERLIGLMRSVLVRSLSLLVG
jgi:hypothetical protein